MIEIDLELSKINVKYQIKVPETLDFDFKLLCISCPKQNKNHNNFSTLKHDIHNLNHSCTHLKFEFILINLLAQKVNPHYVWRVVSPTYISCHYGVCMNE